MSEAKTVIMILATCTLVQCSTAQVNIECSGISDFLAGTVYSQDFSKQLELLSCNSNLTQVVGDIEYPDDVTMHWDSHIESSTLEFLKGYYGMVRYWDSEFNYQKGRKNEFYKTRCIGAFYEIPSSLSYNELNRMFEEVISQLSNTCKYKFVKKKYKMDVINTKGYYEAKVNDRIVIDVSFTQATHSDPYSLELLIRESLNQ